MISSEENLSGTWSKWCCNCFQKWRGDACYFHDTCRNDYNNFKACNLGFHGNQSKGMTSKTEIRSNSFLLVDTNKEWSHWISISRSFQQLLSLLGANYIHKTDCLIFNLETLYAEQKIQNHGFLESLCVTSCTVLSNVYVIFIKKKNNNTHTHTRLYDRKGGEIIHATCSTFKKWLLSDLEGKQQ